MLPRHHRLTHAGDFRRTIRGGVKSVRPSVIVHGLVPVEATSDSPARVGVTVSKAVGGSVVRHRVARRIRHEMAANMVRLPAGSMWVIRALPSADAPGQQLAGDVRRGLDQVLGQL